MAQELGVEKAHVNLAGERVAVAHCVTSICRLGPGACKIVHHHADVSAVMLDVLARLKAIGSRFVWPAIRSARTWF